MDNEREQCAEQGSDTAVRAGFDAVVSEYEGQLLRYVMRIVRDGASAQDIVQVTFVKLFRSWKETLAPSPELCAWLFRVAHNEAIDHLRHETRRSILMTKHAEEQDGETDARAQPQGISDTAERAAGMLGMLADRERQVVMLKVYEEKSYREIAQITGLSESNVGYILHFAMKKLAAALKPGDATSSGDTIDDGQ